MICPKCQHNTCEVINEIQSNGKDFSAGKGICGALVFGPIGVLCGACGKGREVSSTNYWLCKNCGNKFKV